MSVLYFHWLMRLCTSCTLAGATNNGCYRLVYIHVCAVFSLAEATMLARLDLLAAHENNPPAGH